MRKIGVVLGFIGGFLVMLGLLATVWAPGALMKTPLDVNSTTRLTGTAQLGTEPSFPVKATSLTRADSKKSTDDTIVWVSSTCLLKDEGDPPNCVSVDDPAKRLISAGVDNFATNRVTAVAVNDPKLLPADASKHEGLVNKWPFQAEKKTYKYWDGTAGQAVDAVFSKTTKIDGLEAYLYDIDVENAPVTLSEGVEGTYTDHKTIAIEPLTGTILRQVEEQKRTTDAGDNFLTLNLAFTPEQVKANVKNARSDRDSLNLVRKTIPVIGFGLGLPILIAGIVLMVVSGRRESDA